MSRAYESVPVEQDDIQSTIKEWSAPGVLSTGLTFVKGAFENVKQFSMEGNFTLKTVGIAASIALILLGLLGVLSSLFTLNIFGAAFDALILLLGVVCFASEYARGSESSAFLPGGITNYVNDELHILSKPYGRSMVYLVMGFIVATTGSFFGFLIGAAIFVAGGYICYNMRTAELALKSMKNKLADENVSELFKKYDRDGNGLLNTQEIALLSKDLGMHLNRAELEAATIVLDRSDQGVTYEEFKHWYTCKL